MENCVLFDWLTFTIKNSDVTTVKALLGMQNCPFEPMEKGLNGYPDRLFFGNVSICYGAAAIMGIMVNMSGQGCRSFESYGNGDWLSLLTFLSHDPLCNITRLDVAYDDHSGILDIYLLAADQDEHNYISKSRFWQNVHGSDGCSLYFGSPKSDIRIRIYDKAAERGLDNIHWIRVELQLRDDRAVSFCENLNDIGSRFRGVLHNYLRFVVPDNDSNPSRWPMTDYWVELLDGISKITLWSTPGVEYNLGKLHHFCIDIAGSALKTYIDIVGYDNFLLELGSRSYFPNPKYLALKQQIQAAHSLSGGLSKGG